MGTSETVVRAAGRADLKAASAMLARAFEDDPPFMWILPDAAGRPRRLRHFFATTLRWEALRHGGVEVAVSVSDGRIVGATLWLPPGHWHPSIGRQALELPGMLRAFGKRSLHGATFQSAAVRAHPSEPHWYLYVIGVDPREQGSGVGAALLRSRLDRCDASGHAAYLESSKLSNVPLYEHFGFVPTGTLALPKGAPTMTTMWRAPAAPAGS